MTHFLREKLKGIMSASKACVYSDYPLNPEWPKDSAADSKAAVESSEEPGTSLYLKPLVSK